MLAKRCAPELGSDRRPRRCVSPDTTWRFCARRDSVCLWSSSADVLRMVCRRVAYLDGTTAGGSRTGRGTRTPHPLPRVAWLKRCARQLLVFARHFPHVRLPSSPLHKQARPAGVAFRHACVWISMDNLPVCPSPLALPATTGGCGCVWETQHMLLPRSLAQGSDFGLQEWRLAVTSQQCQAQNNNRPQLVSRTTPDTWRERRVLRPCPAISQARP